LDLDFGGRGFSPDVGRWESRALAPEASRHEGFIGVLLPSDLKVGSPVKLAAVSLEEQNKTTILV
jgi:hypothetical protein